MCIRDRVDVVNLVADLDDEDRGAGHVHIAGVDERAHVLVEERQQQNADVGAVDVGVRHDDDLVVAGLGDVEIAAVAVAGRDAAADSGDERLDGLGGEGAVVAHALDVQDLAAQGQDRLDVSAAAVLGRTACRVALYDEELGQLGVCLLYTSRTCDLPVISRTL